MVSDSVAHRQRIRRLVVDHDSDWEESAFALISTKHNPVDNVSRLVKSIGYSESVKTAISKEHIL